MTRPAATPRRTRLVRRNPRVVSRRIGPTAEGWVAFVTAQARGDIRHASRAQGTDEGTSKASREAGRGVRVFPDPCPRRAAPS